MTIRVDFGLNSSAMCHVNAPRKRTRALAPRAALTCDRCELLTRAASKRAVPRASKTFTRYLALSQDLSARVARRIEQRYGLPFTALDVDDFGAHVALPTLVVHDRGDKEVPFEHADAIARALPEATLVATEGLGHRRILRDPAVIGRAVRFIAEERRAPSSISPAA